MSGTGGERVAAGRSPQVVVGGGAGDGDDVAVAVGDGAGLAGPDGAERGGDGGSSWTDPGRPTGSVDRAGPRSVIGRCSLGLLGWCGCCVGSIGSITDARTGCESGVHARHGPVAGAGRRTSRKSRVLAWRCRVRCGSTGSGSRFGPSASASRVEPSVGGLGRFFAPAVGDERFEEMRGVVLVHGLCLTSECSWACGGRVNEGAHGRLTAAHLVNGGVVDVDRWSSPSACWEQSRSSSTAPT